MRKHNEQKIIEFYAIKNKQLLYSTKAAMTTEVRRKENKSWCISADEMMEDKC